MMAYIFPGNLHPPGYHFDQAAQIFGSSPHFSTTRSDGARYEVENRTNKLHEIQLTVIVGRGRDRWRVLRYVEFGEKRSEGSEVRNAGGQEGGRVWLQ